MAVPPYQDLMLPLLKHAQDGKEHSLEDYNAFLAEEFKLTANDLKEMLPSGKQTAFENRAGWAKTFLKKAGLLETPKRGFIKITPRGVNILAENPSHIDRKFLTRFPEFIEFVSQKQAQITDVMVQPEHAGDAQGTPEEVLEGAYQGLREQLAQELLQRIKKAPPQFFERLVVDLLLKLGYGGSRQGAGQAIGQSGDEGLDGVINDDRLGLDKIYIQAKRWDNTVGRPVIQAFAGSLDGQRATKGVFITTSDFSQEARDYVGKIPKQIVLIDGALLAELMIDSNVGVS